MTDDKSPQEIYYDEIAPQLLKIAERCDELGFCMLARIEWTPGDGGTVGVMPVKPSPAMAMVQLADEANGNLDKLVMAAVRKFEDDESSLIIHMLRKWRDEEKGDDNQKTDGAS